MPKGTELSRDRLGGGLMFDRIAKRYDRLNRIMSFGLDRLWRRRLVRSLGPLGQGDLVLDVASGTADVAIAVARFWPGVRLFGIDPSRGMLDVGQGKIDSLGMNGDIHLGVGDVQNLPYEDDHFAASCISFGIRNVPDRQLGLREMCRVTRPGGVVAVLELSEPTTGWMAPLARFHVHHIVPRLGAWLSGDEEYRYLQQSVAAFPPAPQFAEMMQAAGLDVEMIAPQTFGTAHLYVGRCPIASD
ncbi:MAG TPA: bifunctional demethylmenaquinone methyltransferase/2-methoxy-6-polyprenyl-1,4-benzoquinol methylase UbiE [Myxococcales bacterium]|nr:ubiquinone biosynthesis methyltransferase UbiE [Myxococcales bacterium]HAN31183.1 bifunctional demethylmenaquinone methyltransferase/2-methoxy-6-polyprenyl-1,4-benzoquinol methylase UbiE [Myxococcales bacterium]